MKCTCPLHVFTRISLHVACSLSILRHEEYHVYLVSLLQGLLFEGFPCMFSVCISFWVHIFSELSYLHDLFLVFYRYRKPLRPQSLSTLRSRRSLTPSGNVCFISTHLFSSSEIEIVLVLLRTSFLSSQRFGPKTSVPKTSRPLASPVSSQQGWIPPLSSRV